MELPTESYHPLVLRVARLLAATFGQLSGRAALQPPPSLGFGSGEVGSDHVYVLREPKIESTCLHFRSDTTRKVHLEITRLGPAFGYVHAMVFPTLDTASPLFGVDVNATPKKATLAVLHIYPSPGDTLPPCIETSREAFDREHFERHRPLPKWGEVFRSGVAALIQPGSQAEEDTFYGWVRHFTESYITAMKAPAAAPVAAVRARQQSYSMHKRQNVGGAKVLQNALGIERGRSYVDEFLWPLDV